MTAARGVHHLAILVRDLAVAERFYCGTLGLAVLRRWPAQKGDGDGESDGDRSIWVDTGDGSFLALERAAVATGAAPRGEPPAPGLHLVALRIAAAERAWWMERLARAGVAIEHQTAFTLYVRDPEGNRIGFSHYPDRADGEG